MKSLISLTKKRNANSYIVRPICFNDNFSFCTKTNDNKIKFNNVTDVKSFGRKFSDEELKKYLDPYGFLNSTKGIYWK
jgi:hypothetical protein